MNLFVRFRNWLASKFRKRGVYYINGPEVLPPPLDREEEAYWIAHIDEEHARDVLVERNLRLVVFIAKRFENTGTGIEDLISIGTLGLIKAIGTFHADKGIKLATYASRCIENEIPMDEPLNSDWDGNELLLSDVLGSEEDGVAYELEREEERAAVRKAVAALDPRERELIELRYGFTGDELTQKEVADRLGSSQSYISRLEKRTLAHLREAIGGKI